MGEETFKGYVFAGIILALFMFLTLSFVISLSETYDRDVETLTEGAMNLDSVNSSLQVFKSDTDDSQEIFEEKGSFIIVASDVILGIVEFGKAIASMITLPFTMFNKVMFEKLGIPRLALNVILGLLTIAIIFSIWKNFKTGI